ncbi:hypothetical protein GZH47_33425 (plasmid) [Paenibacillus rhizovicinus]|uniref:Uncharacterized protein n=1 Tax=Paenibacillus rhizovicinus TaxID=2704463 RepID=A0A6C0PBG1_9BACL|nr:hypothetical protein [Paenibacillus rhizovicinus]QHW35796.1 hypothetical protein GZH47_33425 [Paenibacillus rhizovicinus]
MDSKYMQVRMPDGSLWQFPIEVVATHKGENDDCEVDYVPDAVELAMKESDDVLINWAINEMHWSDLAPHAEQIEPPTTTDYERAWMNSEPKIVDYN